MLTHREVYHKSYGHPKSFLKMIQISEAPSGGLYCVPFIDDGKFCLSVFNNSKEVHQMSLNEQLGISEGTMPNESFQDPYSVCTFPTDDKIFITVFH